MKCHLRPRIIRQKQNLRNLYFATFLTLMVEFSYNTAIRHDGILSFQLNEVFIEMLTVSHNKSGLFVVDPVSERNTQMN